MIEIWVDRLPRSPRSNVVLSAAEQARAAALGSQTRRARYVATRTWARETLAARLGVAPADVPLCVDERGALALMSDRLKISLSHHRSLVALAASSEDVVGVDVLCIPNNAGAVGDTALVLSSSEVAFVRRASPRRRGTVFAHCWTRKEAFAKLSVAGLGAPLTHVTLTPSTTGVAATVWSCRIDDAVVAVAAPGSALPAVTLQQGETLLTR